MRQCIQYKSLVHTPSSLRLGCQPQGKIKGRCVEWPRSSLVVLVFRALFATCTQHIRRRERGLTSGISSSAKKKVDRECETHNHNHLNSNFVRLKSHGATRNPQFDASPAIPLNVASHPIHTRTLSFSRIYLIVAVSCFLKQVLRDESCCQFRGFELENFATLLTPGFSIKKFCDNFCDYK